MLANSGPTVCHSPFAQEQSTLAALPAVLTVGGANVLNFKGKRLSLLRSEWDAIPALLWQRPKTFEKRSIAGAIACSRETSSVLPSHLSFRES
ncbi:hypothetical protein CPB86DRAFT_120645 [Serendipita vermifera]|nr:hypothetical protein CPB86DRAFT_120645 [Serendipita vermifera]